ncbi:hypothetical protein I7X12_12200 [Halosimplex litoreum]|uniref:Uncharacterized protein n=1 Tax=Halosimplex litoreum TaxID=1198301 RepID=A0A7T3KTS2_9EURY|nr:hypothetical protein [Halosimplex litoreum]QPV61527.1 hypothetical protein I7X12_12200 [Halosimplex litoreum]
MVADRRQRAVGRLARDAVTMADGSSPWWPLGAGLGFAVVALALVGAASLASEYGTWGVRGLATIAAVTVVVGAACWAAVVERPGGGSTSRRGAVAGALVGLLGPGAFFAFWSLARNAAVLGIDPLGRLGAALFVGLLVPVSVAPLTLPLGAVAGYLLGRSREVAGNTENVPHSVGT